ncbi:MAG: hypothetical protein PHO00_08125 [bacterium]|nr:hypothetical protein [bacterium]
MRKIIILLIIGIFLFFNISCSEGILKDFRDIRNEHKNSMREIKITSSKSNLKNIWVSLEMYAMDYNSYFPIPDGAKGFDVLQKEGYAFSPEKFICDWTGTKAAEEDAPIKENNTDYEYRGGLKEKDRVVKAIVWDKAATFGDAVNILFSDGSIKTFRGEDCMKYINDEYIADTEALAANNDKSEDELANIEAEMGLNTQEKLKEDKITIDLFEGEKKDVFTIQANAFEENIFIVTIFSRDEVDLDIEKAPKDIWLKAKVVNLSYYDKGERQGYITTFRFHLIPTKNGTYSIPMRNNFLNKDFILIMDVYHEEENLKKAISEIGLESFIKTGIQEESVIERFGKPRSVTPDFKDGFKVSRYFFDKYGIGYQILFKDSLVYDYQIYY